MSSLRTWLLPSLSGCVVLAGLAGLAACTVSSGPDTDDGDNIADDDDDTTSSSSSSSGASSSSSSSGALQGTCKIEDVADTTKACGDCSVQKCESDVRACFTCTDDDAGAGNQCAAFIDYVLASCDENGTQADYDACVEAARIDKAASAAVYDAFSACQRTKCAVECDLTPN